MSFAQFRKIYIGPKVGIQAGSEIDTLLTHCSVTVVKISGVHWQEKTIASPVCLHSQQGRVGSVVVDL